MGVDATAAVIAHGLFNAVAAVGATAELLADADDQGRPALCDILGRQLGFLESSIDELGDDATGVRIDVGEAVEVGAAVKEACEAGDIPGVRRLVRRLSSSAERVGDGLRVLVQGLPPDVVRYLDELNARG